MEPGHTYKGDTDFNTKGRKSIYQEFEEKLGKKMFYLVKEQNYI